MEPPIPPAPPEAPPLQPPRVIVLPAKKTVKVFDLEKKKQLLDMLARGEKQANVARHFKIGKSTERSIKKKKDNILKCYNDSSVSSRSMIKHSK